MSSLYRSKIKFRAAAVAVSALALVALFAGVAIPAQAQTYPVAFPAPTTFALDAIPGSTPHAVATGDFNGDGKLDVVSMGNVGCGGGHIDVLLGNGDGTFQALIANPFGGCNYDVHAFALGDFNGDRLLDVAVWGADASGNSVVFIFLGNGTGSLTYSGTYTAPNSNNFNPGPSSIVASDVNGDGKLDLVALTPYNGVYVFLGNGNGTFQTPANYSLTVTQAPASAVAVADLTGDGKPDLAINVNSGLGVLLNNGNGTFAPAVYYAEPGTTNPGIAIGDVNGDKKPDVVLTNYTGDVVVFLNAGNGTFTLNGTVGALGIGTQFVALADINGDKKLDIIVADALGEIWTFYGKGNGTFTSGPGYPLQSNAVPNGMILADFNGDGALDILEQDAQEPFALVALGRGDGTFQMNQFYAHQILGSGNNIVTADFNGDGIPDVAYSYAYQGNGTNPVDFAVMLGSSHGALGNPTYVSANSCTNGPVEWIATGDVNGDRKADIVATLKFYGGGGCQNNHVAVLTGKGTGKFNAAAYYPTGTTAQEGEVFLADLTGNGKLDIVTSNSDGTISVLLNKGNGTYNAGTLITSIAPLSALDNALAIADFNGDGVADMAVTPNTNSNLADVYVLLGKGDGTFGTPIKTVTPYYPLAPAAADFNKDGKMDLLVAAYSSGCSMFGHEGYAFLKGNGDGTFTPGPVNCTTGEYIEYPVVADFNGDGKLDAFIPYAASTISGYGDAGPTILQGNGDGTFMQLPGPFYVGAESRQAAIADFNGDGTPDVAIMDNDGNGMNFVTVMLNSSQPVSVSPLNVNYGSVTVGAKKTATVVLTNNQKTSLAISSITVGGTDPGDFSETSKCGSSRKAGWDCTITVTFKPTVIGARTATLSIKDAVGTQTVQLKGTGK